MEGSVTKKAQMENRMKTGIEQFRWEGEKKKKENTSNKVTSFNHYFGGI